MIFLHMSICSVLCLRVCFASQQPLWSTGAYRILKLTHAFWKKSWIHLKNAHCPSTEEGQQQLRHEQIWWWRDPSCGLMQVGGTKLEVTRIEGNCLPCSHSYGLLAREALSLFFLLGPSRTSTFPLQHPQSYWSDMIMPYISNFMEADIESCA